jgi:hypothetical protein
VRAESAEFATSREEIEEEYRRRVQEYKKKHGRSAGKAGGSTEAAAADAVKEADSVAKIQCQATGVSEMSAKDDMEGQVRGRLVGHAQYRAENSQKLEGRL